MDLRREEIDLKKQEEGKTSFLSQQQLKMQQEMLQMIQQATPRSAKTTGNVSAATTSNHAVPSYTAATTISCNAFFV